MSRIFLLLFVFAFPSYAEVPEEIKKSAGYRSAVNIMQMCTSAADTLLCLSEIGSVCVPIDDQGQESYRCRLTVSIDATRISDTPQGSEIVGDFLIVTKLTNSESGWSAEIEEVTKS